MQTMHVRLPDGLQHLDVSRNQLSTWPIYNLPAALHTLLVNNNQLQDLFSVQHQQKWIVANSNKLVWLNASHNLINSLPTGWHLPALHTLDVSHNELVSVPGRALAIDRVPELDTLILDANPIESMQFGGGESLISLRHLSMNYVEKIKELNGRTFKNIGKEYF